MGDTKKIVQEDLEESIPKKERQGGHAKWIETTVASRSPPAVEEQVKDKTGRQAPSGLSLIRGDVVCLIF